MWPIYNDHRQRNIAPTARSGRGDIALGLSAPESLIDDVAGLLLDGGQMVSITQGLSVDLVLVFGARRASCEPGIFGHDLDLSLIHISEPTRLHKVSRMPSSA